MDEESRKLLLEVKKLAEDNHSMLKKLRRAQKNSRMLKGLYWAVIITITFYAYRSIRPYIVQVQELYDASQAQLQSFKDFGDKFNLKSE